ncbi:MAG: hypothetical protein ACLT98_13815 [Eggerthellaceae bacterium]
MKQSIDSGSGPRFRRCGKRGQAARRSSSTPIANSRSKRPSNSKRASARRWRCCIGSSDAASAVRHAGDGADSAVLVEDAAWPTATPPPRPPCLPKNCAAWGRPDYGRCNRPTPRAPRQMPRIAGMMGIPMSTPSSDSMSKTAWPIRREVDDGKVSIDVELPPSSARSRGWPSRVIHRARHHAVEAQAHRNALGRRRSARCGA